MKQINILKKAAGAISILLLLLSLAACGNMLEERKGNTVVEPVENTGAGILVRGEIKVQGAVPSRAATSCFDGDFSWRITAQNLDITDYTDSNFLVNSFTTTNRFTITLPCTGNWLISASGYAGTFTKETLPSSSEVFSGFDSFTITEEGSNRAIVIHPVVWGDSLFPTQGANPVKGSINLPITSNAENVYQVSAKLIKNNSTTTATEEVVTIPPKTFTTGSSSLEASDVPAGFYTAKIIFEDSIGNILYSCHEGISVYPGLTTDTWYGTAPYLNNGTFTITSSLVEKYGTEFVPSTNYVLYNATSGTWGWDYDFYITSDPENPGTAAIHSGSSSGDSWSFGNTTFDSEGNIYTLFYKKSNSGNGFKIYKNENLIADSTLATSNNMYYERISYDTASDTFYLGAYESEQFIYMVSKDVMTSSENLTTLTNSSANHIQFSPFGQTPYKYAVHDGLIYYVLKGLNNHPPRFYIYDSSNPSSPEYFDLNIDANSNIGDIIYQDGNVYILLSESNDDLGNGKTTLVGRGGVLKYNILTDTLDTLPLGWTSTDQNRANKWFQIAWYSNGETNDWLYTSENEEGKIFAKANDSSLSDFAIYSPETPLGQLSTKGFYGPKSFVAIKPKKLVILDEGIAFYTDAEGLYKYKNVNRIVTVDLEDFAISGTENVPSSIAFSEDSTGIKPNLCSYSWAPVLYNEDHEVIFDASDETSTITLHSFTKTWPNGIGHEAKSVTLNAAEIGWSSATVMGFPLGADE